MRKQMITPTASPAPANKTPSIIGNDVQIEGNIQSASEIHLEGRIKGDLKCDSLVMGEHGHIEGHVHARAVTIRGQVNGNIHAEVVQLERSSEINGDVFHESLTVESGARLNGRFEYTPNTAAKAVTGPKPAPKIEAAE